MTNTTAILVCVAVASAPGTPDDEESAVSLRPRETEDASAAAPPPGSEAEDRAAPDPPPTRHAEERQDPPLPADPPLAEPIDRPDAKTQPPPAAQAPKPMVAPDVSPHDRRTLRPLLISGVTSVSVGSGAFVTAVVLQAIARWSYRQSEASFDFPFDPDDLDSDVHRRYAERAQKLNLGAGIAYAITCLAVPVGAALLITHRVRARPNARFRGLRLRPEPAQARRGGP